MSGRPKNFPPLIERIKARCRMDGGCWVWTGDLKHGKRIATPILNAVNVRRYAYIHEMGEPRDKWRVVNHCGDPMCINPQHQRAMSPSAYTSRANKNRIRSTWGAAISRGRSDFKLRPIVGEIRERLNAGETGISIAARYGISRSAVSDLKRGRTWREVSPWAI